PPMPWLGGGVEQAARLSPRPKASVSVVCFMSRTIANLGRPSDGKLFEVTAHSRAQWEGFSASARGLGLELELAEEVARPFAALAGAGPVGQAALFAGRHRRDAARTRRRGELGGRELVGLRGRGRVDCR